MFRGAEPADVLHSLEAGIEAGAERYRLLVPRVRGQRSAPDATEELHWLAVALRIAVARSAGGRWPVAGGRWPVADGASRSVNSPRLGSG